MSSWGHLLPHSSWCAPPAARRAASRRGPELTCGSDFVFSSRPTPDSVPGRVKELEAVRKGSAKWSHSCRVLSADTPRSWAPALVRTLLMDRRVQTRSDPRSRPLDRCSGGGAPQRRGACLPAHSAGLTWSSEEVGPQTGNASLVSSSVSKASTPAASRAKRSLQGDGHPRETG
jgi:hypothetical protein